MTVVTIEYKHFSEWPPEVQARIIEKNRHFNVSDSYWYENTLDAFKEAGALMGIRVDDIAFSLGYSQSDYAGFTGYYKYKKGALKAIKAEFPAWLGLHQIAEQLQREQCRVFFSARTHVSMRRDCMRFETYQHKGDYRAVLDIEQVLREFGQLIYSTLRTEYECQTSDAALIEYFRDSDYEFNEEGDLL